jgi:small subunit ribosomal protein S5
MNVARPARCLFCSFSRVANVVPRVPRRQFHPSFTQLAQKPKQPNAKSVGYKNLDDIREEVKPSHFERYTDEQKAKLAEVYSPEQIAAIEAAEEAIDPKDLAEQFSIRRDPMKFYYFDDFSVVEPVVDHHIRAPKENTDYNSRLKEEEELDEDIWNFIQKLPEDATNADLVRFVENTRMTIGKEESERNPHMSILPDIFERGENLHKDLSPDGTPVEEAKASISARDDEELTPDLIRVLRSTGLTLDKIRSLKTKTLVQHGVVNQTRLGKIRRYYCLSVAGNGNGLLGLGEAKSEEPLDAAIQSRYRAIRNMQPIPRYENRTIYGDVRGKVGAVELKLMNRPPGM